MSTIRPPSNRNPGAPGKQILAKESGSELRDLNSRSREIFRQIVETYLTTGEPVGSRNLSRFLPINLSPASVRNVMSDLEALGLIYAPHTSAGRLPTESGLRLFVDALLEVGDIDAEERRQIETQIGRRKHDHTVEAVLAEASEMISGLSHCAGVVMVEKQVTRLKHIEFVRLEPSKALVVLVSDDGRVENRVIDIAVGMPTTVLVEAANFLNYHIKGKTLAEARLHVEQQYGQHKAELDELTARLVDAGIASWSGGDTEQKQLIVRGQSNLLADVTALADLERIRRLFSDIESKREIVQLLGASENADGVRIFIGSENQMFSLSGSSIVVAPFKDSDQKIVGVLGVIGPTRLNYARIIPMVDFTAKLISRLVT